LKSVAVPLRRSTGRKLLLVLADVDQVVRPAGADPMTALLEPLNGSGRGILLAREDQHAVSGLVLARRRVAERAGARRPPDVQAQALVNPPAGHVERLVLHHAEHGLQFGLRARARHAGDEASNTRHG
jgi:hypothetical protein